MKNLLIITKLLLFPYILFCQSIIHPDLNKQLNTNENDKFFSIIIDIRDNFNLENLKAEFYQNQTPVKKRASIICQKMQHHAQITQKPILDLIKKFESDCNNVKSTWIINNIFLDASPELIRKLAQHPNIAQINLKKTQADVIEYIDKYEQKTSLIENGTEPGIEAINIRPLWEMGYTGNGVLVFNYDTGVWPEHPAFSDRFLANLYPMNQCWDGYFSNIPNGHVSDHGTHTLGTMAGLVKETNDTIGIAFKSYWIANDFVTSSVATLPPIEDMITSFEWALNPDGDIYTYHDVPDVINNSWRWYNEIDTFQCSGYAVELMNVIEAAGIANIFSAGNNGPNNDGVRSPQRINSNLVNTFCVGSINGNDEEYPISTFSCRGPTQCPGDGSLSIYPEVVAPGQNIRSAWGQDGFNTISGTSMASPHVSGLVMLLKEAFPFVTGQEILLAIYNTASDLGENGEDNTYGMGIIDGYSAFNYLANIYEPVPPNFINNDLILTEITNIPSKISCESSFTPTINIFNSTDSIIEEIKVFHIEYMNEINEDSINFEVNLAPYSSTNIELPTFNNTIYGDKEYSFRITTINTLTENDYHNNRKMLRFKYKPTFNLPFIEDFQDGINKDYWHINNNDYSRTWDTISTDGLNNNTSSYVNLYDYNPRSEQKDELISPNIIFTGDSIKLSFQVAYQKYNNSSKQDTLQVYLSKDCGQNFNYKIFEKGGEDLSTYNEITANFIPQTNNQWRQELIELSEFSNEEITLKFVTTNLRGNNIFIDNINIYNNENNNLVGLSNFDIEVYPNPSNNIFEFKFNPQFVNTVKAFNMIGATISKINYNKKIHSFQLSLENQKPGVYFVEINSINNKKIMRIVKK